MSTVKYGNDPNPPRMHIKARKGEIGEYVILPGDPFRCEIIAAHLEDAKLIAHNREHKTYTGTYKGLRVSVTSTGMGCPSASIAAEELISCGAKVLIRLGSGFLLRDGIKEGDMAITLASMKLEGTTEYFVPKSFPAVADVDLVVSLASAANRVLDGSGYKAHSGITATVDGFYGETPEFIEDLRSKGIMNIEMESAAIFTAAQRHGVRAACLCSCGVDSMSEESRELHRMSDQRQIEIILEAMVEFDKKRKTKDVINHHLEF